LGRTTQTCEGRPFGGAGATLGGAEVVGVSVGGKTRTRAKCWGRPLAAQGRGDLSM
jgi:hypothetical protein